MHRSLYIITATALAASTLATSAFAADLAYEGDSLLAAGAKGKPYWMIQAQCSGFFEATGAYMAQRGDTDGADKAKAQGVAFFRDAVDRLARDRDLTRPSATEAVSFAVEAGRAEGLQKIQNGGRLESRSHWNVARSVCLDVNDAYKAVRYR